MARSKAAQFRISPEEDQHLRHACLDAGFDQLSEYLRAVLLEGTTVSVGQHRVVVIPSTTSEVADDEYIHQKLRAILAGLRESSSASEGGGMVGALPSQSPPAQAAAPSAGSPENQASAPRSAGATPAAGPDENGQGSPHGAIPGEFEGTPASRDSQPEATATPASGAESPLPAERKTPSPAPVPFTGSAPCPDCGGTGGRHQSFCAQITGEPPVQGTEEAPDAPETERAFLDRRVAEQEADGIGTSAALIVAEAEWRKATAAPAGSSLPAAAPPAPEIQQPCPTCGAMKTPSQQCRDCGTRPTTI